MAILINLRLGILRATCVERRGTACFGGAVLEHSEKWGLATMGACLHFKSDLPDFLDYESQIVRLKKYQALFLVRLLEVILQASE